ncbi:MAG: ATP-binding protein [Candidatus Longimicrobiales bacterium M2_2A_002]
MSVRVRLALTFVLLTGVFLVPMQYAGARLTNLREMAVERRSQHASASLALGNFRAGLASYDSYQRAYLVTLDTRMGRQVDATLEELQGQIERLRTAGYPEVTAPLEADLDSVMALSREIDRLVRAGRVDTATQHFERYRPLRAEMVDRLETIATAVDRRSEADFARAEEMSATAARTTVAATVAALVLALLVGAWTTRALTRPLDELSSAAARVADGTFREPEELPYRRSDEIGDLSRSFRAMTRRLAELDRLKAEFMSVASHELKTPIAVIQGYTELIDERVGDELAAADRELIDAIAEQAAVMTRLVSRLLDIGRLEAGTYRMEREEVHVVDIIEGLAASFRVMARERGIRFVTEVDPSAPTTVNADPDMIRGEVLGNLISNALRFTPRAGEVRVRVWREGDDVVFEVSDTGPGIPAEQRPHIFEKYWEGGRTQSMGSGLGLAVAKEAIEAHGGRITLEAPGAEGATFRVYLPIDLPDEPAS